MRSFLPVLIITLLSCDESTTIVNARCELEVESLNDNWQRGDSITLFATPLTDEVDTLVLLNNTNLMVNEINTSSCTECDACKTTEEYWLTVHNSLGSSSPILIMVLEE